MTSERSIRLEANATCPGCSEGVYRLRGEDYELEDVWALVWNGKDTYRRVSGYVQHVCEQHDGRLDAPAGVEPVIVFERSRLSNDVVLAFISIEGPLAVPETIVTAGLMLSKLLEDSVFDGMTSKGGFYWALWCGTNGRYVFETDREGLVLSVCYRRD